MLHGARVSSFMLGNTKARLQCGNFDSRDSWPAGTADNITDTIFFPQAFNKPPVVCAGLSGWDVDDNWRIHLWTTNASTYGFEIHIDAWDIATLYSAMATWIAIDADTLGVLTGDIKGSSDTATWSGSVNFAKLFLHTGQVHSSK
jgi:hypothetical protein